MGTIWVREFTGGLDARRLPETSAGGTLIRAKNCHINRGGEIEQRADFVKLYDAPANTTVGLASDRDGLVVFGHISTPPPNLPSFIRYQRLEHPTGEALVDVLDATLFEGRVQATGLFADGSAYLFDDGTRVDDADAPPNRAGSGNPGPLLTFQEKLFSGADSIFFFSAVGDPADYSGTGAGFIDMSTHARGTERITALTRYQQFAAVFSRRTIQIWFLDPDPTLSRQAQVLTNTGTPSPNSVVEFGDSDVIYVDQSGIRSLKARDSSNNAFTTDIGSPIDPLVSTLLQAGAVKVSTAIEPQDGRVWIAINDTIFVFSYFPGSRVSAWATYEPGFLIDRLEVFNDRVYVRSGDSLYVYGSQEGPYHYSDTVQAEAWLPYLDADRPAQPKMFRGLDASCRGEWEVRIALAPDRPEVSDKVATITTQTFNDLRIALEARANHISARFLSTKPVSATKPAVLSSVVLHHDMVDEEGA